MIARALRLIALAASVSTLAFAYDQSEAINQVYLSGAAYCSGGSLQSWSCGAACDNVGVDRGSVHTAYDSDLNVFGFAATRNGQPLLSFRGTNPDSLQDWIDDLSTEKTTPEFSCGGCEVHDGFYQSYLALKP
jgi:hypothetical protein